MGATVSVAVTNYNGESYLDECLSAIKAQSLSPAEILVVDNHSTDGSLQVLAEKHPDVRVITLKENRGPGAARNLALSQARHRYLLSVDNDAVLTPTCLAVLAQALSETPEASLAQARVVYHAEPDRIHYDGGYLNYTGIVSLRNQGVKVAEAGEAGTPVAVDAVMAVTLLVDRRKVGPEGLYDEGYHFYFEDIDFSYRLRLRGQTLLVVPEAVVLHREGTAGLSYRAGRAFPGRRAFYFTRNRWRFALKMLSRRSLLLAIPGIVAHEVAYLLFVTAKGHLLSYVRGLRAAIGDRGEVRELRRGVQATRVLPDRELLRGSRLTFVSTDDNRVFTRWAERSC